MFVNEAFSKDGQLSISYEDSGNNYSVKSGENPKPSLTEAMKNLRPILFRNLEIPDPDEVDSDYKDDISYKDIRRSTAKLERTFYSKHFMVIGASHSQSEQNGDKFKIIGLYKTTSGVLPVRTSAMSVPEQGASFWNGKNAAEYPGFLTPEDCDAIETFFYEVEAFIAGERDQKELFDKNGEPKEDADIAKATDEPEKQPEFFEGEEKAEPVQGEDVEEEFVDFTETEADEDF